MKLVTPLIAMALLSSACSAQMESSEETAASVWKVDFFDDFETFNNDN